MPPERYIATFIAPNMEYYSAYDDLKHGFIASGVKAQLLKDINQRLEWEIGSEYTFDARIGRTLEKSGCTIASVEEVLLNAALERLSLLLVNELDELRDIQPYQFALSCLVY